LLGRSRMASRPMLARLGKLTALVLDFVEQPNILDRNRSLVAKGRGQLDLLVAERPHLGTCQGKNTDRHAFAQHWNTKGSTEATKSLRLGPGILPIIFHIGDMATLP
jgi:hypothetical protein